VISVSEQAIIRYRERVKPALDFQPAKAELEALIRMAGDLRPGVPDWASLKEESDGYFELADGVAAVVRESIVTTVLARGGLHSSVRAARNERKRRKRARRRNRPKVYSGQARKQVEPRQRWR